MAYADFIGQQCLLSNTYITVIHDIIIFIQKTLLVSGGCCVCVCEGDRLGDALWILLDGL